MRCELIKAHRGESGPIGKACGILRVSRSECCDYSNRPKPNAQAGREAPEGFVVERFEPTRGRHGHRRVSREPGRDGMVVSEKRVLAVMRRLGLQARGTTGRHRRAKPVEGGDPRVNLINRVFDADAGNRLRVGDITYIDTDEGWLYLAAVTGAWHRKVVGWSMSDRIIELYYNGQRLHSKNGYMAPCDLERDAA